MPAGSSAGIAGIDAAGVEIIARGTGHFGLNAGLCCGRLGRRDKENQSKQCQAP